MSDAALVESTYAAAVCEAPAERWCRRFGGIAIAICVLIAYANSFQSPFVFDGANYLLVDGGETPIRDISTPAAILKLLDHGQTRALVYLTFGIDYRLFGYDVRGWHATSTLIHICAALALYGIARHGFSSARARPYFDGGAERMALAVALLWAVHPLNTQSVTYLYQRLESLMGMFYFLTIYLMTRYATTGRLRWGAASVLACTAGMASKEVMVTAPLVVLWYDRVFCCPSWDELTRRRGAFYVALAGTWGMLYWLMSRTWGVYADAGILDESRITPMEYALTQPGVIARYMRLAVVPYGLNIDYAWVKAVTWPMADDAGRIAWLPTEIADAGALARSLAIVGGCLLLTLVAVFRAPALGFLAGSFFVVLAPTSSIAPIVDLCFEHRTYVSLAPLSALVAIGVRAAWRAVAAKLRFSPTIAGATLEVAAWLAVAVLVSLTLVRNHDYRSTVSLWGDAATKAPRNPRAQYNYGVYLQIDGQIDKAIVQYERAIVLDENYTDAYLNLARLAVYQGRKNDADHYYQKLLDTPPLLGYTQHLEALYNLADLRLKNDDPGMAKYYVEQMFLYTDGVSAEGKKFQQDARTLQVSINTAIEKKQTAGASRPSGTPPAASTPSATR